MIVFFLFGTPPKGCTGNIHWSYQSVPHAPSFPECSRAGGRGEDGGGVGSGGDLMIVMRAMGGNYVDHR